MIVVKLIGGLGNQMFQYAAAKALALRHGVALKADLSFLNKPASGYTPRTYELAAFNADIEIAGEADIMPFKRKANNKLTRFMQRSFPFLFSHVYATERGSGYQPAFESYPQNTYLDGYWQSEKYFAECRTVITSDFSPKAQLPEALEPLLQNIKATHSVSVHVRRGDYVSLPSASAFHGTCSVAYYQQAVALLAQKEKNLSLFVFSDDIDWCKANLVFSQPVTFVSHDFAAVWDLYLMSQCRHNIIANSSFSWWGAWLNANAGKTVVAPKQWFADPSIHTNDLIPHNWIRL